MTIAEKIEMFKAKKAFVEAISQVFVQHPKYHTVVSIQYEVYQKELVNRTCFEEWIVVHFQGGGKSPRLVSGNSNIANYRAIGNMIDGGYYAEVDDYEELVERDGYELVALQTGSKLDAQLEKPMKHIANVRSCFEYCTNIDDVEKVISRIPAMFGTFTAYVDGLIGSFRIINEYNENGDTQVVTEDYDFYEED